jgi:hypothetical protein
LKLKHDPPSKPETNPLHSNSKTNTTLNRNTCYSQRYKDSGKTTV